MAVMGSSKEEQVTATQSKIAMIREQMPATAKYAYLNTGKFLSSNPGIANGGVKITMYDSVS